MKLQLFNLEINSLIACREIDRQSIGWKLKKECYQRY